MFGRIFVIVVILTSIALGILASTLPNDRLADLAMLQKLFLAMLPVLGVGALIKYLLSK